MSNEFQKLIEILSETVHGYRRFTRGTKERIARCFKEKIFLKNQIIIKEGDFAKNAFIIREGECSLVCSKNPIQTE